MSTLTKEVKRRKRQRKPSVLEQLIAGCSAERVSVHFVDGRALEGALLYNPIKRSGKLINIDKEFSIDFETIEVRTIKVLIGRVGPHDFPVLPGVSDSGSPLVSESPDDDDLEV